METIRIDGVDRALNMLLPPLMASTLPDLASSRGTIPVSQWRETSLLDTYKYVTNDQGPSNTCVNQALAEGLALCWQQQGNGIIEFHPWFVYNMISPSDNGASISDAFEFCKQVGIIPDDGSVPKQWLGKGQRQRYPEAFQRAARWRLEHGYQTPTWEEIGSAAQLGFPTEIGVPVFESWQQPNEVPIIRPQGRFLGWHAILVTGFKVMNGEPMLEFLNSWGTRWGAGGKAYLPKSGVREPVDAFAMQNMVYSGEANPPPVVA